MKSGEIVRIEWLYRQYDRSLRRFLARQRLSGEEVSDIAQEAYCRIHESTNLADIRNPRAFLFRVARNIWLNREKHRGKGIEHGALDIDGVEVGSGEPGPYRSIASTQELAVVRAAIDELPPKCREAFIMHRFESMTYSRIAVELGLSVSMIEKHMSFAIAHLHKRLEGSRRPRERVAWRVPK